MAEESMPPLRKQATGTSERICSRTDCSRSSRVFRTIADLSDDVFRTASKRGGGQKLAGVPMPLGVTRKYEPTGSSAKSGNKRDSCGQLPHCRYATIESRVG